LSDIDEVRSVAFMAFAMAPAASVRMIGVMVIIAESIELLSHLSDQALEPITALQLA
jgi:hypothetical protein